MSRPYRYVGPAEIRRCTVGRTERFRIRHIVEGTFGDVLTANHARGLLTEAATPAPSQAGPVAARLCSSSAVSTPPPTSPIVSLAGQVKEIERAAKALAKADTGKATDQLLARNVCDPNAARQCLALVEGRRRQSAPALTTRRPTRGVADDL